MAPRIPRLARKKKADKHHNTSKSGQNKSPSHQASEEFIAARLEQPGRNSRKEFAEDFCMDDEATLNLKKLFSAKSRITHRMAYTENLGKSLPVSESGSPPPREEAQPYRHYQSQSINRPWQTAPVDVTDYIKSLWESAPVSESGNPPPREEVQPDAYHQSQFSSHQLQIDNYLQNLIHHQQHRPHLEVINNRITSGAVDVTDYIKSLWQNLPVSEPGCPLPREGVQPDAYHQLQFSSHQLQADIYQQAWTHYQQQHHHRLEVINKRLTSAPVDSISYYCAFFELKNYLNSLSVFNGGFIFMINIW
ncbi:uncharacterized protein LOC135162622 [Diachasmimorpha longicaudata]|uniref:uncharacterized protein LOC135162622 n=1 Tax=Diachasmimorpha longicaudata TaxID=58733 RepID=UPI0030B89183